MKLLAVLLCAIKLSAATYTVGPSETIKSINALPKLVSGDIVEIQPGLYKDVKAFPLAGTPDNPVTVRCIGPEACKFYAGDTNLQFTPRAIFEQPGGAYRWLGPFNFRDAHNGGLSAAGIRIIGGWAEIDGLSPKGMKFRNCDNGITSSVAATSITVRNVDIEWSGRGSAHGHSAYFEGLNLLIEDSTFNRTLGGLHIKSRARNTVVRRVELLDSKDGEFQCADGESTGTPGADCVLEDVTVQTLAKGRDNCCRVLAIGNEGKTRDRVGTLRLRRVKGVLNAPSQILVSLDSLNAGLEVIDSDFQGTANLIRQRYGTSGPITGSNNRVSPTVLPAPPTPPPNPWTVLDVLPPLFVAPTPPPVDITPPTQVTGLTGTQTPTGIILSWQPSTDAGGIARYEIVTTYGPFSYGEDETSFYHVGDTYPAPRTYTYQVKAVDRAGNEGPLSLPFTYVRQ